MKHIWMVLIVLSASGCLTNPPDDAPKSEPPRGMETWYLSEPGILATSATGEDHCQSGGPVAYNGGPAPWSSPTFASTEPSAGTNSSIAVFEFTLEGIRPAEQPSLRHMWVELKANDHLVGRTEFWASQPSPWVQPGAATEPEPTLIGISIESIPTGAFLSVQYGYMSNTEQMNSYCEGAYSARVHMPIIL